MSLKSRLVSLCVLSLVSVVSMAQTAPDPPAQEAPIGSFLGRYLDSSSTQSRQAPNRTYRAQMVKASIEDDMLYFTIGSHFVGQKLSTFMSRLAGETRATGPNGEKVLAFDHAYAHTPTQAFDLQNIIGGFDWDDRGYKYVSYTAVDGLVILDEDFQALFVERAPTGKEVVAFRSGDAYYVLATDQSIGQLDNVTTPASPTLVRSHVARAASKSKDGHIAVTISNTAVKIYTFADFVANGAGSYLFSIPTGQIMDIASDGTRFFVLATGAPSAAYGTIYMLTPSGNTYTSASVSQTLYLAFRETLSYGAGYLTAIGGGNASLYEVGTAGLTLLGENYLGHYGQVGFGSLREAVPLVVGGQTALFVQAYGLGDVFALDQVDPMTLTKAFAPATIDSGAVSELTVTITNPLPVAVTFNLGDDYPSGMTNGPSTPTTTCSGGTLTATTGSTSFALTNATLAANSSCTIAVQITSSTPGLHTNTIPAGAIVSSDNTNTTSAAAMLKVLAPFGAPPSFNAFATSATNVAMSWVGVSGATSYEIFRNNQPLAFSASSTYTDTTAAPNTAYLYKVRAIGASPSAFSNVDLATTVTFTDSSLNGLNPKAVHITQLRTAVDAVRALASLPPGTYTDAAPAIIKAAHITDLRTAIDQARAALLLPALTYTNTIVAGSTLMKAVDVTELRARTQ